MDDRTIIDPNCGGDKRSRIVVETNGSGDELLETNCVETNSSGDEK